MNHSSIYLTETRLGEELNLFFPNQTFVHNRVVPESGILSRPDYRCDALKLIVEFDGHLHYCDPKVIKGDIRKDNTYSKMGYQIVRIPYFVQLSTPTIKYLFGLVFEFQQYFPHGFISSGCILPAMFCEIGVKRFKNDLSRFEPIKLQIVQSL